MKIKKNKGETKVLGNIKYLWKKKEKEKTLEEQGVKEKKRMVQK